MAQQGDQARLLLAVLVVQVYVISILEPLRRWPQEEEEVLLLVQGAHQWVEAMEAQLVPERAQLQLITVQVAAARGVLLLQPGLAAVAQTGMSSSDMLFPNKFMPVVRCLQS